MNFKDHFSAHAELYRAARPHYPDALFDWIAGASPSRACAWDAGCGNGQASVALAERFERMIASDPSREQIRNAEARPNIEYRCERGEHATLPDGSADAIIVAQALHWFDLPAFAAQVQRVAKPGALFAAWCYAGCSVTPAVDAIIARLYDDTLGACWSPERRFVDEGYASFELPFASVPAPTMELRVDWPARHLLAYLDSWSAAQRYRREHGRDAIAAITQDLLAAWGDAETPRPVRWQLAIRAWRVAAAGA
ncbi:MAG TPA: class I SAM-dependent methyltransferase [Rhodanobacteraceae bacterium]|nr:class I SAM-dependent methyltransferase [Rhodanobacteraceae bacterium]